MRIVRRLGKGGASNSSGARKCPDFLELDTGDFLLIGADVTEQFRNALPEDGLVSEGERIVLIPRRLILSAKNDIPNE